MRTTVVLSAAALILAALNSSHAADRPAQSAGVRVSAIDAAHAKAVDSFRRARFPEAYGRFIALAAVGHAPSARVALWMCEQGPELFGRDWDCTPDEVTEWTLLARAPAPQIGSRTFSPRAFGTAVVGKPAGATANDPKESAGR